MSRLIQNDQIFLNLLITVMVLSVIPAVYFTFGWRTGAVACQHEGTSISCTVHESFAAGLWHEDNVIPGVIQLQLFPYRDAVTQRSFDMLEFVTQDGLQPVFLVGDPFNRDEIYNFAQKFAKWSAGNVKMFDSKLSFVNRYGVIGLLGLLIAVGTLAGVLFLRYRHRLVFHTQNQESPSVFRKAGGR
jgi:hypothetical protein